MPITIADVEQELALAPQEAPGSYTDRDTLLYAVAIGMGRDPLDARELEYVCESVGSRVVPTASTVLTRANRSGGGERVPSLMSKMNYALLLHGEQRLQIHQTIPPAAETLVSSQTKGVYDKGKGK
ncbi:MAG: 3-alpha,7-alpha,12-alpha-trihydroxy-5-beta-cholest-24-enoyl-CoA hydratase, partial [Proteobacteria bacterium]|nr:3-alpha,7-alpha,12-alpha-trihydroxy-5-beta-cholest-24-enoyl-CoA hydratase [Pseudomonadota bacterium]